MNHPMVAFVLGAAVWAAPVFAQTAALPAPSPIEKELAARAANMTEVT
jgi:hypothetical protein